jgi:homoserine kinase type II
MKVVKKDIKSALSHYDIGNLINYTVPNQGLLNRIIFLKTTKGRYVLKIALVNIEKLSYVLELLDHINMITAPKPLRAQKKRLAIPFKGYKSYIYSFIPGKIPKRITSRMLREIGSFLAEYHNRSKNFKICSRREEILSLSHSAIKKAIFQAKKICNKKGKEAASYIEREIWKYPLSASLPEGPIHVDVKPDNSLFEGEKLRGVVDFDNAYCGPLILDIGVMMSWYGIINGKFDMVRIRELYRAYIKVRKLTKIELEFLFNAFHFALLRNSLRALELLAQKKLPQKWVFDYIDNYLKAEKFFPISKSLFSNFLTK